MAAEVRIFASVLTKNVRKNVAAKSVDGSITNVKKAKRFVLLYSGRF